MTDHPKFVPVIGLVGGVGSGKSHLAQALVRLRPAQVEIVSGDLAGHQVLEEESVKQQIREHFGDAVFDLSGAVDRRKMAALVFGSGQREQQARAALEQIVHPRIGALLKGQIEAARHRDGVEAVLLDAALMFETGWDKYCDAIVFIDTPEETRFQRVHATRGWTRDNLKTREESQLPLDVKRREANYVVDNSGSPESAVVQFTDIYCRIVSRIVTQPKSSPA